MPPTVDGSDHKILDWRVTRIEEQTDHHGERLDRLERQPHLPDLSSLPWLQIVGLVMLLVFGLTGRLSPEIIEGMSKLLPRR